MKTLNEILVENSRVFPFLAARMGAEWIVIHDRVHFSNENDEDAKREEAEPVANGYFYGVDPRENHGSLISPDMRVWERWSPIRRSGQIRDLFDKHQETCDSCGLGNTPKRCPGAETLRHLYIKMKEREVA